MESIINNFNFWWQSGQVPTQLVGKPRKIFNTLADAIDFRQILILTGLRRVGKTTLLFQLIDWLLREKKIPALQIFYYSFDESRFDLGRIIEYYRVNILKKDLRDYDRIYFFFDEIQKLPDWASQIKIWYDLYPNIKIIISGSANVHITSGSRESLAGRFFEYVITPLDFFEYLEFKSIPVDFDREMVYKILLQRELNVYLKCGGFIEAINFEDWQLKKYFKESILERVTFRDLPELYPLSAPDLLLRLLQIIAQLPGLYLDYNRLGNDLKYDQRTIANYFSYLEFSFLVQKLFNYSPNLLTSEKKIKRAYLANTGFTFALADAFDLPRLLEQFWINILKPQFFYRSPQKDEVDLVVTTGQKVIPVEIKIRRNIQKNDLNPLMKFLKQFNQKTGLMISQETEEVFERDGKIITIFPYWKYGSIRRWLDDPPA